MWYDATGKARPSLWGRHQLSMAKGFHGPVMGRYGFGHFPIAMIGQIELAAFVTYNPADGRVVDMADPGKEVVFNLEVQPAHKPGDEPVARCEIGGGF